ncbi:cytochrome c oxidase subunit 5B, mitochondrial-like [Maniola hyperantus]|uniref:cytochrome c oxidase subunit 5B, mitochondrial-like n=1 Tax=Aphantopus hyperantus TaxID=2795564 RepID=UPI0015680C01|nr:cytochrome c oxidase subunit 5B, mitochondrial-like [Maniola hyperantus]
MWWPQGARYLQRAGSRIYGTMHDTLDQLTGIEKRELLAHLAGECDPFRIMSIKRGPGTRECPNLIPSAYSSRLVGCVCHPDTMHIEYMWVHMGWPRRCGCGYWFELCPVAPL